MKTVGNEQNDDFFVDHNENRGFTQSAFSLASRMMFYLTEIERFRPDDPPVEQAPVVNSYQNLSGPGQA